MGKGGGGQPAPSAQNVSNTSIPTYAQPYVEGMLGQTAALTDINQNPYQQYGGQRLAGFTPQQAQAMTNVSNMQVAPQLGQATGYAGQAGQGLLGTTGTALGYGSQGANYGQMGVGIGQQATQSGANYQNMATSPAAMQAYMNPYIQQSLDPQLRLLNQQQALAGQDINAKAVGQGAFGGNRATLAQGLNAQNYDFARQKAIGEGYNTAFNQAQQAQQFGANLGLQGLQTGLQGTAQGMQGAGIGLQGVAGAQAGYQGANQAANTLGQLGQTQYGQQMGINQAQMQAGALQQAQQQQGLDVGYQDFLKQQNYPYQQQAFMSDMLRGLPLSQSAQTQYTAPPSAASQLGGLGMAGLGIYGMSGGFKGAKGGTVGYAKGGQIGYSIGGDISMMTTQQLTQLLDSPNLTPMEVASIEEQLMLRQRMENNPQTSKIMSGLNSDTQNMGGGLDTVPSGDMFEGAGGGIVAFAGTQGSVVKSKVAPNIASHEQWLEDQIRAAYQDQDNAYAKSSALQQQFSEEAKARKEMRPWEMMTALGVGTAAGNSQYGLSNLGQGGVYALQQAQKSSAEDLADRRLQLQQQVESEKSADARKTSRTNAMQTALGQMYNKEIGLKNVGASAAATATAKASTEYNRNWNNFQLRVGAEKTNLINSKGKTFDYAQNPSQLDTDAYTNVYRKTPPSVVADLKLPDPKQYANPDPEVPVVPEKLGAATPAAVSKPQYLPMPASAAEAVKGKIYNTAKGPAKWDGKLFIPL